MSKRVQKYRFYVLLCPSVSIMSNIFLSKHVFGALKKKILPNKLAKMNKIEIKELEFDTNFNSKMDCKMFLHIGFLPSKELTVEALQNIQFKIAAKDGSHEPILTQLTGIVVLDIEKSRIPEAFTYASHAMDEKDFVDYLFTKYPARMATTKQLGIYQYKKIA